MIEIREVLRLWVAGEGYRAIARLTPADRKTVNHVTSGSTSNSTPYPFSLMTSMVAGPRE